MIVKLDLSDRLVWELSKIAERKGVTVSDIVSTALVGTLTPTARSKAQTTEEPPAPVIPPEQETSQHKRLRQLWRLSFSDADIAADLGMTPKAVGTMRRLMGLPANRRSARTREAARRATSHNLIERKSS